MTYFCVFCMKSDLCQYNSEDRDSKNSGANNHSAHQEYVFVVWSKAAFVQRRKTMYLLISQENTRRHLYVCTCWELKTTRTSACKNEKNNLRSCFSSCCMCCLFHALVRHKEGLQSNLPKWIFLIRITRLSEYHFPVLFRCHVIHRITSSRYWISVKWINPHSWSDHSFSPILYHKNKALKLVIRE